MEQWGYVVLVAKFFTHFVQTGYLKCLGLIIPTLVDVLDSNYATIGFLVSLEKTMYYVCCPFANVLSTKFDGRVVAIIGNVFAATMVIALAFTRSTIALGICLCLAGCGSSTLNQTSHVILHQHFGKKFGSANSLTLIGTIVGSMVLPYMMVKVLESYGIWGALLCIGGVFAHLVPIACCMRAPRKQDQSAFEHLEGEPLPEDDKVTFPLRNSTHLEDTSLTEDISEQKLEDVQGKCQFQRHRDTQFVPALTAIERGGIQDHECMSLRASQVDNADSLHASQNSLHARQDSNKSLIKTVLNLNSVRNEFTFATTLVPCISICLMVFGGWVLFLVSYGVSKNMDESEAVYLPIAGAAGGIVGRSSLIIILSYRPDLSLAMLGASTLLSAVGLLLYQVNTTFKFMVLCSFVTGLGVYSSIPSFFGVLSVTVAKENVPGIMALQFFTCGISNAFAGYLCGKVYDVTRSFHAVFIILGSLMICAFALVVCFYVVQKWKSREDRD